MGVSAVAGQSTVDIFLFPLTQLCRAYISLVFSSHLLDAIESVPVRDPVRNELSDEKVPPMPLLLLFLGAVADAPAFVFPPRDFAFPLRRAFCAWPGAMTAESLS